MKILWQFLATMWCSWSASLIAAETAVEPITVTSCQIKAGAEAVLSTSQSGILAFSAREGDAVKPGQRVIGLKSDLAATMLAVAEKEAGSDIEIRYIQMSSDVAKLEYEQAESVNGTIAQAITLADVRRRKLEYDRSVLQIEQARHQHEIRSLKRAEAAAHLDAFHVEAPFDGVVIRVLKHPGEMVQLGEPVLELVNVSRIRVEGFVDYSLRNRLSNGQEIRAKLVLRGIKADPVITSGRIVFVDSIVQPVTHLVRVCAEVENPAGALLPGLSATMELIPGVQGTDVTLRSNR